MSTTARPRTDIVALTRRNRIGLGLAGVLGVLDLVDVVPAMSRTSDVSHASGPPLAEALVGAVFGVITVIAVSYSWRTGRRIGSRVVAGSRVLSALIALPAFFLGVPAVLVAVASFFVLLSALSVGLVLSRR